MSVFTVDFLLKKIFLACFSAIAIFLSIGFEAQAATDINKIEVGFDLKEKVNPKSFNVVGCEYIAPSASGRELIFKCPVKHVYQVEFIRDGSDEVQTNYGALQIRPDLYIGAPYVGALHLVSTYSADREASLKLLKEMPERLQPLILKDMAVDEAHVTTKPVIIAVEEPAPTEVVKTKPTPKPTVALDPIVVAQASDPSPSAVMANGIDVSWASSYGSLRINGKDLVEETQEADGLIQGRINLTESLGDLFILSSDRNSSCNKAFTVEQLKEAQEVFFECSEYTINAPFKLPLENKQCLHVSRSEVSCLVSNNKKTITVKLKGWKNIDLTLVEDVEVYDLSMSDLYPEFPASTVMAGLNTASANQCDPRQLELHLGAFCLNDLCTDLAGGPWPIDESGYLQSLAEAGWDLGQLPTKAKLVLVDISGETAAVLGEEIVPLKPVPVEAVSALIRRSTGNLLVPLNVETVGNVFKVGRSVKFFEDSVCKAQLPKKYLDLSNPGNKLPNVPKCSFYRIFDGNKTRSSCTAVAYNKEAQTATAVLEVAKCDAKRLVLYVAENETINGRASKAIVASLVKLANGMKKKEECASIDIVHTVDEKRQIILSAEDMRFPEDGVNLKSAFDMRFVNSNSEILRDFEWIYRIWGDNLGGIIVIVDGENAKPIDMIASPAAMAWKIKDVFRRVINFSAKRNCKTFKDVLLFEECEQGRAADFDAVLSKYIDQGLSSLVAQK